VGDSGLRATVLRGGVILASRTGLGMVLGLIGLFIATRILGPSAYGSYVTALGIHQLTQNIAQVGVEAYLVRGMNERAESDYDVASTFLLGVGLLVGALEAFLLPRLGDALGISSATALLPLLAATLPVQLVTTSATARLDRDFAYGRIASIELITQAAFYVVAAPLALVGFGAWAFAIGWVAQQVGGCILAHAYSRWLPRPRWDWEALRRMLRYSVSYATAIWLWQARGLVSGPLVAATLGLEAAGVVNLTIRVVEMLSFGRHLAWRVSLPALATLQNDRRKMLAAIAEGTWLQVLLVALPLAVYGAFGAVVAHGAFGARWLATYDLFPYLALASLTSSAFALESSALMTIAKNFEVALFHIVHLAMLTIGAFIFMKKFGMVGYGYAELFAMPSCIVLELVFRSNIGRASWRLTLPTYTLCAVSLALCHEGLWAAGLPFLLLAWPPTWPQLATWLRISRSFLGWSMTQT